MHKWKFKNDFKDIVLTFDGEEFHLMHDNVANNKFTVIKEVNSATD